MTGRRRRRNRYEGDAGAVTRWSELEAQRAAEAERLAAEAAAKSLAAEAEARRQAAADAEARRAALAAAVAAAAKLDVAPAASEGQDVTGHDAPAVAAGAAVASPPADALPEPIAVSPLGEPEAAFALTASPATTGAEIAPGVRVERRNLRRRRMIGITVLVVVPIAAFVIGLIVFNNWVMPQLVHSVGQVRVPDLSNLTLDQAELLLKPLGLQLSRAGERFDPSVPRGFVLSQEPDPGTEVRGRKRISVVMSLGEEFSSVPELFGESPRAARLLIERAGLHVGGITRAPSDEVGQGLIVSSDPGPETVLMRDTPVHLLLSTGPGEENYVMPDLLGHDSGGVRRQLEALGFHVAVTGSAQLTGTIVAQSPVAGSRISPETPIALQTAGRGMR